VLVSQDRIASNMKVHNIHAKDKGYGWQPVSSTNIP
jgi:hypothetical protein